MRLACVQTENEQVRARPAARATRRHPTRFAAGVAAVLLCCLRVPSRAEPPTWLPSPAPPKSHVSEDLELSLRARDALFQDKVLAGQLLGISVRNGVATLWGRASSPNVARRAEDGTCAVWPPSETSCTSRMPQLRRMGNRQRLPTPSGSRTPSVRRQPWCIERTSKHLASLKSSSGGRLETAGRKPCRHQVRTRLTVVDSRPQNSCPDSLRLTRSPVQASLRRQYLERRQRNRHP
jgi:hypothetical protein